MHTQGPWEAKHLDANHFVIESGDSGNVARTTIPIGADAAVVEANAKLIASAPEMLDMLNGVLRAANVAGSDWSIVLKQIRGVVAKATGR